MASHRNPECTRVQDAYSLRCSPQVHGAVRDTLAHAEAVAARELAAAIDNPVVLPDGRVESNGNFHGAPLGYVLDFLAIAVADLASISERRTDRFLDVARSAGLPPFLADDPGVDSGHMIAQYTQAGIVAELKRLAVPASVDSIPSSAMQEDHVSMGWAAARKLRRAVDGLGRVLAVEVLTAARALDLRAPLTPAPATAAVVAGLRAARHGPRPGPPPRAGDRRGPRVRHHRRGRRRRRDRHRKPSLARRTSMEGARPVRAPRGTTLTARSWQTEAPLRMLQNNLDPEVAERPDDLVVYGGTGRAARDWRSFDAMVRTLTTLGRRNDARAVRQAGRRAAHARVGAAGAHRQLQPRRRLGHLARVPPPRAARPHHVRPDDRGLVDLHRHPGDPAGHLRDVRGRRRGRRIGGTLAGTLTLTGGCGGMGGAHASRSR